MPYTFKLDASSSRRLLKFLPSVLLSFAGLATTKFWSCKRFATSSARDKEAIEKVMSDEIVIGETEAFFLHPGELALGATEDSVTLPDDIVGWLDGRSSLARLGLMVHVTAHRIDPGWSGNIVLEFFNSGKLPLALRPGMSIGAISFEPMSGPADRPYRKRADAKYRDQDGPTASRISEDK